LAVPAGQFFFKTARGSKHFIKEGGILVELEQRVKSLEYEVKILKNEIQRTLLEIQEQILVHYYPDLRLDEGTLTEGVLQSFKTIQEKKEKLSHAAPPEVKQVSIEEARALRESAAAEAEG
jgi:hypothetical protein